MTDCVFCGIARGSAPASVVHRDDRLTVFLDHQPVTPGHLIVIPNRHLARLAELNEELAAYLFKMAMRMAAALRASGLRCDGINLFLADGEAAFQDVNHAHLHVIPRTPGDGFTIDAAAWADPRPSRDTLDANARTIRAALAEGGGPG